MWEERILHLDGEAIVLDKPAGLAVHRGPKTPRSLEDDLHHFRFGFQRSPQPVHRLDRDTSGCLLLARNPKAHRRFQLAFEEGRVEKTYFAIVEGCPEGGQGRIDSALAKVSSRQKGWRMMCDAKGKPAITEWRVLAVEGGRTLIEFRPRTGRTHQIRIHAADVLGSPIVGDPVYGRGGEPMLLHARALKLQRAGKPAIDAVAPLPRSFAEAGFADAV